MGIGLEVTWRDPWAAMMHTSEYNRCHFNHPTQCILDLRTMHANRSQFFSHYGVLLHEMGNILRSNPLSVSEGTFSLQWQQWLSRFSSLIYSTFWGVQPGFIGKIFRWFVWTPILTDSFHDRPHRGISVFFPAAPRLIMPEYIWKKENLLKFTVSRTRGA